MKSLEGTSLLKDLGGLEGRGINLEIDEHFAEVGEEEVVHGECDGGSANTTC